MSMAVCHVRATKYEIGVIRGEIFIYKRSGDSHDIWQNIQPWPEFVEEVLQTLLDDGWKECKRTRQEQAEDKNVSEQTFYIFEREPRPGDKATLPHS